MQQDHHAHFKLPKNESIVQIINITTEIKKVERYIRIDDHKTY